MHDEYYQKYKKTIVIDIDDTISFANTFDDVNTYSKAVPNINLIKTMQKLHKEGYTLILHTARGWISCNQDTEAAEKKYRKQIETWLAAHNVPYDALLFGKPFGIYYVDDKAMRPDEFVEKFSR